MNERGATGLESVQQRIRQAEADAGKPAGSVRLVAVSKKQPVARIEAVLAAGHRTFGENRVQEAEARWPSLAERFAGLELHLVGPLQGNKVRPAVELFDCIESLDRPRLARRIADAIQSLGRAPRLFVQVNTGAEAQKSGVMPGAADPFIATCREEYGLAIDGLMSIPPIAANASAHFSLLAGIAERNGIAGLSMGMSADFEAAIRLGATHVRVGTAVFGSRDSSPANSASPGTTSV